MILITGATGYIGRHLVARMVAQGERPRVLVRDLKRAAQILPTDNVELVQADTLDPNALQAAVQGVDTIVHAAFISADHKESTGNHDEDTNVRVTGNLIREAQERGVRRM